MCSIIAGSLARSLARAQLALFVYAELADSCEYVELLRSRCERDLTVNYGLIVTSVLIEKMRAALNYDLLMRCRLRCCCFGRGGGARASCIETIHALYT